MASSSKNRFALIEMILFGVEIIFSLVEVILCLVTYKADLSAKIITIIAYFVSIIVPIIGFVFANKSYRGSGIKDAKIALLIFLGAVVLTDAMSFGGDLMTNIVAGIVLAIEVFYFVIVLLDLLHPGNKGYHSVFNVASIIVIVVSVLACIGYITGIVTTINNADLDASVKLYSIIEGIGNLLSTVFLAALYRSHYNAVRAE